MSRTETQILGQKLAQVMKVTQQPQELTAEQSSFVESTLKDILAFKKTKLAETESRAKLHLNNSADSILKPHKLIKQLKQDLFNYCMEVVCLVDTQILPKTQSPHGKVFFLKVKGDFLRYSAEGLKRSDCYKTYKTILQEGLKAYSLAYEIATQELPPGSSIYLNLCLNFSVFYYVVAKDANKACQLASKTLIRLKNEKESITEELWKSIQPTKCLLKNNLIYWLSN